MIQRTGSKEIWTLKNGDSMLDCALGKPFKEEEYWNGAQRFQFFAYLNTEEQRHVYEINMILTYGQICNVSEYFGEGEAIDFPWEREIVSEIVESMFNEERRMNYPDIRALQRLTGIHEIDMALDKADVSNADKENAHAILNIWRQMWKNYKEPTQFSMDSFKRNMIDIICDLHLMKIGKMIWEQEKELTEADFVLEV